MSWWDVFLWAWLIGGVLLVLGSVLYAGFMAERAWWDGDEITPLLILAVVAGVFLPIALVLLVVVSVGRLVFWAGGLAGRRSYEGKGFYEGKVRR